MGALGFASVGRCGDPGAGADHAVVYSEFSIAYARIEEVDRVLAEAGLELTEIPRARPFSAIVLSAAAAPAYCQISL